MKLKVMIKIKSVFFIIAVLCHSSSLYAKYSELALGSLTCEYRKDPIGIGVLQPRLSWKIYSDVNNQIQTAYQILVASSAELLKPGKADLWDSKKVNSDQSILVTYKGKPLTSRQKCYWQVRVWDKDGNPSAWSAPAYFEIGLLQPSDWNADWIKTAIVFKDSSYPSPVFRKEFKVVKKVKTARLYCTSLGLYEFYINGKRVGDRYFAPGWTSYSKRLQYQVYDISDLLSTGRNAAGIVLGNGWYRVFMPNSKAQFNSADLEVLAQLEIEFADGTRQLVKTDASWKSATGAIQKSEMYNGEIYDARLEENGWNNTGFNDNHWSGVAITKSKKEILVSEVSEPVKKIEEITPVKVIYTPQGDTVLDMGQNMVGWCRLQVECPKGTIIKLRHAEVLDIKGNLYTENLRKARQEIIYTCKGGGVEIYEPHFSFQGFRYVKISGYPKKVSEEIIKGIVLHSNLERTGTFSCNNELVNQLQHNIVWGQKGNFVDVPTDCPQRDERLGWTGDAQIFAPTSCYNMQSAAFWTKWLYDVRADQSEDGSIPNVIPQILETKGASGWADAAVIVPWVLYQSYGDVRILEEQYTSMKKWVEYMRSNAGESYLYGKNVHQYGDWLAFATARSDYPGATTDKDLLATAYFYRSTDVLQRVATILQKKADAENYRQLRNKIKEAFIKEYVTPNGRLSSNTQTAYVVSLAFGLLPEAMEAGAAARLAEDVRKFKHITTGFLGTADICHVLSKYGYLDEAYSLLYRKEYPSWLYPVTKGATTIWERWDGIKANGVFQTPRMNSFNHYAYGAIGNWMYKVVAGINNNDDAPGYKRIIIKPLPGNDMNNVNASYESLYGKIVSQWRIDDNTIRLTVEIPANTSAEIWIPSTDTGFLIDGKVAEGQKPIQEQGLNYHFFKTKIGSGRYEFETLFQISDF